MNNIEIGGYDHPTDSLIELRNESIFQYIRLSQKKMIDNAFTISLFYGCTYLYSQAFKNTNEKNIRNADRLFHIQ